MHELARTTPDSTRQANADATERAERAERSGPAEHAERSRHVEHAERSRHVDADADGADAIRFGWRCPICACGVVRPHRPGRARVYCTNACRQKAYRWRRRHRRQLCVTPPPQRARSYDRTHALRADDDLVTPLIDDRGRRVTACGTFARAARDAPRLHRHVWFFSITETDRRTGIDRPSSSTCQRCTDLLGVPRRPIGEVLAELDQSW